MAGSNRRFKNPLFPIDESLLERLLDREARARGDDDAWEDGDLDDDPDLGALVWHLEEDPQDAQACDNDVPDARGSDADALSMRVLNDYLRRRLIDDPDPIVHTLH